ncbi:MAG: tetratricopeptide repeat protein [Verrucomicrobia bacterium]|jgi:protein O-mannosyl-transferase|nr:tetratricopeptide repeat protein [Verrucomicrobiota bacterium]
MKAGAKKSPGMTVLAGLLVAVAVVTAYANSFAGVFLMDDGLRILQNPAIRDPLTACIHTTRPLVGLSLWMNLALGGQPADFHLFNLIVHLSAVLLFFGLIRRTCRFCGSGPAQATVLAAIGAAVWGTHPLQTQSVTYIIQRAESMMGMLSMLVLYCFIRAAESTRPRRWLAGSVLACALGMTAKPVMVVVPLAVVLFDWQFVTLSVRDLWQRRAFYLCLFATVGVAVALSLLPNESSSTTGLAAGLLSPARYMLTECGVIVHYLKCIAWPTELCLDYAWPSASGFGEVWWQALLLCVLLGVAAVGVWRRSVAGFGLALFLMLLAPSSSVIPVVDAAVEHRLYLPLAGAVVCVGALLMRFPGRTGVSSSCVLRSAVGVAVVLVLITLTHQRNADYHSVLRMSRDTVEKRPDNLRARSVMVMALLDAGEYVEGELEARELVKRLEKGIAAGGKYAETGGMNARGYYPIGLNQLGRALLCRGRETEAIAYFDRALVVSPTHKEAWFNKAIALNGLGKPAAALEAIEQALAIDARYEKALNARTLLEKEVNGGS